MELDAVTAAERPDVEGAVGELTGDRPSPPATPSRWPGRAASTSRLVIRAMATLARQAGCAG